jgi:hypothetical protein
MSTEFYWRDFVLVVGGRAFPGRHHVAEGLTVDVDCSRILWCLYALIGSATTFIAVTRPRGPKVPPG